MTLTKRIFSGYIWTIFGQWIMRLSGLVSTLILVRILTPADFGLIPLAMLVIGFFDLITGIGVERYILLQDNLDDHLLNSSWTANFILKGLMVIAIYALSGHAANYFGDARLEDVLKFVCITQILPAFKNVGMVKFIKAGNFKPVTFLGIISRLFGIVTTLYFAYSLRNYWCMVYGSFVSELVGLVGSYFISNYRPKLDFKFHRHLFEFSYKLMFRGVTGYTRSKLDIFLVGHYGTTAVGKYSVAQEFALLPLSEIISPAAVPFFSGVIQYKNDKTVFYDKVFKYLSLVYLFVIPAICGIFITAEQIADIVLGGKWVGVDNTIRWLAVLMLPFSLQGVLDILYDSFGKSGTNTFVDILGIILIGFMFYYFSLENLDEFVMARSAIGLFIFSFMILIAKIAIDFSIKKMLMILLIPCIGSLIMLLSFYYIYTNTDLTILGLALNVLFGAFVYFISSVLLFKLLKNKSDLWHFGYSLIANGASKFIAR